MRLLRYPAVWIFGPLLIALVVTSYLAANDHTDWAYNHRDEWPKYRCAAGILQEQRDMPGGLFAQSDWRTIKPVERC